MTRIMPQRLFVGSSGRAFLHHLRKNYSSSIRPLSEGERYLGSFIVPVFQRSLVWTETQKVRLIESLYMGLPVGAIVWNQTLNAGPCDRWLLDGQQRVTAIIEWFDGVFPVSGYRYSELPDIERQHFDRMGIEIIETDIADEATCREVYDRLVYGGTPHDPKVI